MKPQVSAQLSVQGTVQDGGKHARTEEFSIFFFVDCSTGQERQVIQSHY